MARVSLVSRWACCVVAVVGCVVACGGTEFSAGSDGGTGATGDAASVCVTPPAALGTEADFCHVETKLLERCDQCQDCHQTDLNNCVALGHALSGTFKSALDSCVDQIACGDYTTYAGDSCVGTRLANATPTAAQASAKAQYCAKCATDAAGCLDYFRPARDGGAAGIGLIVLLSSDEIATAIATECSGTSPACGALAYEACAIVQFCKTQAPDACKTGYCGK